jgi:hypothetical protein
MRMIGKKQLRPLKRVIVAKSEIGPQKQATITAKGRVEDDLTVWSGDYARAIIEYRSH